LGQHPELARLTYKFPTPAPVPARPIKALTTLTVIGSRGADSTLNNWKYKVTTSWG